MTEEQLRLLCQEMKKETFYHHLPDNIAMQLVKSMEEIELTTGQVLVEPGASNSDIYLLASGVMRQYYINGGEKKTFAFCLPGTFIQYLDRMSHIIPLQVGTDACSRDTIVLRISSSRFDAFLHSHPEAPWWWIELLENQVYCQSNSVVVKNGDARTRLRSMMEYRPDIMRKCSMSIVASYLGITPSYLSTLRSELVRETKP